MYRLVWRFVDRLRGRARRALDDERTPKEQLGRFLDDLNLQLRDLRDAAARALTDEKRLRLEIHDHLARASDWERRAVLALEAGDEDLAAQSLLKKRECDGEAIALEESWKSHKQSAQKLKDSLEVARRKVEAARRKYSLSLARYESAQAQKNIVAALSARDDGSVNELVEKLDDRIRELEAETAVELELMGEAGPVSIESRFRELESRRASDDALARLKASLGETSAGPGSSSRIDEPETKLDES